MAKGKGKGRDGIHAPLTLAGPSSKWHTPPTACSRSTTAQWTAGHTSPSASSPVRALGGQWAAAMARQWGRTCASLLFRGHSHPENHISCRLASPARQGKARIQCREGPHQHARPASDCPPPLLHRLHFPQAVRRHGGSRVGVVCLQGSGHQQQPELLRARRSGASRGGE